MMYKKAHAKICMSLYFKWWRHTDLNRGHSGYEPLALANWAMPPYIMELMTRIELVTSSLPRMRSTIWATSASLLWLRGPDLNQRPSGYEPDELPTAPPRDKMVEGVGFEPTKRNAADLQSAPFSHSGTPPLKPSGADNRNRTYNLRFTKPLLCLLSYVSMISVTVSIIHETEEFVNCFLQLSWQ